MKLITPFILLCLFTFSFNSIASDLVSKSADASRIQKAHDSQREKEFQETERELKAIKAALIAKRNAIQSETDALTARFSDNEVKLSELEAKLQLETGSLGELFGVVRQSAKVLNAELNSSVTGWDSHRYSAQVAEIVAEDTLPSMSQLTALWQAFQEQIQAGGELKKGSLKFINSDGRAETVDAARIGAMGIVTNAGYVRWNASRSDAVSYMNQSEDMPVLSSLQQLSGGKIQNLLIDPSRGVILNQQAKTPTLSERFEAGGAVGKMIAALFIAGLIIAFYRGISLFIVRQKINRQLKNPHQPGENPLGRVLSVYSKEQSRSVEALELRLLEAVVDEQLHLERGLSMLKLLAALAPMLGLLGTVTGMIETFQVITQYGNGDPKVMAGGISMALVTTVLGLVAAMPMLLAHNLLSSQAEMIRNILERQGIGLVAERAEQESETGSE